MVPLGALACILALLPSVSSQAFLTPLTQRQLFRVGEIQKIQYRTTLTDYTIALWQQALAGGSATLGPVVVRITNGPEKEFNWLVQSTGFDLDVSNVFFFWLKEGGFDNLGSTQVPGMSSAYFNITDEPLPSSSSTFSSTIASSSSSSITSSILSTGLPSTLSTELSSTLSNTPSSTARPTAEDNASTATPNQQETSGGALPVAAQAGIGVGAAIVGLTAIVCGIMWFRYLRKQQRTLVELQQQFYSQPPNAADMEMWKSQIPQHNPAGLGHNTRPAELS